MLCHALGFEDRAGLVKSVEGIGRLEEMVGQKVRTEVVEDQRDNFAELEKFLGQGKFGRFGQDHILHAAEFGPKFAENRPHAHVGILQIGCGIALQGEHFGPGKDVVAHPVLGEFGIFDGAESHDTCDVFFFLGGQFRIFLLDHGPCPTDGLVDQVAQWDIVARAGLHEFVVLAENTAEGDMLEFRAQPHAPRGGEHLLEVQLLRGSGHIPDGVRVPSLDPVFNRGEVGGGIEETSVALADEARFVGQGRNIRKENAGGTLADLRGPGGEEFVDQRGERGIVETFPETFVEADPELCVDLFEFGPGQIDELLPDGAVFRVALLEFDQFFARRFVHGGIGLLECVDLAVETRHFRNRVTLQRTTVEKVLPTVKDFAELRAPIAEMVVGHDFVAGKPCDAGQRIAQDRAADVPDVHRLGNVGRTEVDDDAERILRGGHAAAGITRQCPELPGDPMRFEAEVEKARTGNFRLLANVARLEIVGDLGREFARVGFRFLGQNHGGIGLVVAESCVGCRGHLAAFGRQSAGSKCRVQPFGQHGLRRGAHSAVTAAAGENLQNGLRIGRGRQFLAHRAVVEEFGDGGEGAQMDLELVPGNNEENDEVHEFVVERVKFNARGRASEGGHHFGDVLGGGMRDGDAEADAGAHRFLALLQGV